MTYMVDRRDRAREEQKMVERDLGLETLWQEVIIYLLSFSRLLSSPQIFDKDSQICNGKCSRVRSIDLINLQFR